MTKEPDDWQQRADELAAVSVAAGEPTAWFEQLYAAGRAGSVTMPWDRSSPNVLLQEWASERRLDGNGRRAVVVGAGLGADAAYLADLGYDTTAFDVSPTAVAIASERVSRPDVHFEVADLLALPDVWLGGFDLVVEIYTVQALPRSVRAEATAAVGRLVAAGGMLLAVQAALGPEDNPDEGPPWPLTREEVEAFATGGLSAVRIEPVGQGGTRFGDHWLVELIRS
jgi:SAM-dependent methyltransferase